MKKNKIIISSVAIIVVCLLLITGTTFALFTDNDSVNIVVNSGKVDVTATVDGLVAYSDIQGVITPATEDTTTNVLTFENGGTVEWNETDATLTLNKITPGDFVEVTVKGTNASTVAVRYRYIITLVDDPADDTDTILTSALTVKVGNTVCTLTDGKYFVSEEWTMLPVDRSVAIEDAVITIGIDETVGNGYEENGEFVSYHDRTAKILVVLEAIQGNGFDANGNPVN